MDVESLLTRTHKEEIVKARLNKPLTIVTYDRRYAWDFHVRKSSIKEGSESFIHVTFSVPISSKRFTRAIEETKKAVEEIRTGKVPGLRGKDHKLTLVETRTDKVSLGMKLGVELSAVLREKAFGAGFHPTTEGVKRFLEREYL